MILRVFLGEFVEFVDGFGDYGGSFLVAVDGNEYTVVAISGDNRLCFFAKKSEALVKVALFAVVEVVVAIMGEARDFPAVASFVFRDI